MSAHNIIHLKEDGGSKAILLEPFNQLGSQMYTQMMWCYDTANVGTKSSPSDSASGISSSLQWKTVVGPYLKETFLDCVDKRFGYLLNSRIARGGKEVGHRLVLKDLGHFPPDFQLHEMDDWCPSIESLATGCTGDWPIEKLKPIPHRVFFEGVSKTVQVSATWCHDNQSTTSPGVGRSCVVIVLCTCHLVMDGTSNVRLMNEWATWCREVAPPTNSGGSVRLKPGEEGSSSLELPVVDQRSVVEGCRQADPASVLDYSVPPPEYSHHTPGWFMKLSTLFPTLSLGEQATHRVARLRFPRSVLQKLQDELVSDLEVQKQLSVEYNKTSRGNGDGTMPCGKFTVPKLSKNDALVGLLWKYAQPKSKLAQGNTQILLTSMNVRTRLPTPISEGYIGNAVHMASISRGMDHYHRGLGPDALVCKESDIGVLGAPVAVIAKRFHEEVRRQIQPDVLARVVNWETHRKESKTGCLTPDVIFKLKGFTNWRHMAFYSPEGDFTPTRTGHCSFLGRPVLVVPYDILPNNTYCLPPASPAAKELLEDKHCQKDLDDELEGVDVVQAIATLEEEKTLLTKLPKGVRVVGYMRPLPAEGGVGTWTKLLVALIVVFVALYWGSG